MELKEDPFQVVKDSEISKVVEIIGHRLPRAGNVYNMAKMINAFRKDMECYSLDGDLTNNAIIMIIAKREDYGQDINFSIPEMFKVTDEIKQKFVSTKKIDWRGAHLFTATDRRISHMIFDISTSIYRNSVIFNPNYNYYISSEKAVEFEMKDENDVLVKSLDKTQGLKFLLETWKYAALGADRYLTRIIDKNISSGVYCNGEIVSAAVINSHGLIGVLNTSLEHRGKGYALKCMKYLLREMALQGFAPVSTAQQENFNSLALHEKLGMIITHESDYIFHIPYPQSNR